MSIIVELNEAFDRAEKINVYNEGAFTVYCAGDDGFNKILIGWKDMIEIAHEMPAFGVSLNSETLKARDNGLWAEFVFGEVHESGELPYEKLLVSVKEQSQGFNLIRYNSDGGYDGRCFYYDLMGKDMSKFYDILLKL